MEAPILHTSMFIIVTLLSFFLFCVSLTKRDRKGQGGSLRLVTILLLILYYTMCHYYWQWNWCGPHHNRERPSTIKVTVPKDDCMDYVFEIAEATGIDPADMKYRNCN